MATAEHAHENWGGRDEAGYIRGLKKKGMTVASSIAELLDNSSDAGAKNFRLTIANQYIYFGDDAGGMNMNNLKNMLIMERENNGGKMTKGGLGVGLKNALALLSNYINSCVILTKTSKGEHLKIEIPWNRIFKDLRWINMIPPAVKMSDEEVQEFNQYVPSENKEQGTVIRIKKREIIVGQIKKQFSDDKKTLEKIERWDMQIQSPPINISLCDYVENPNSIQSLDQYKFICNDEDVYLDLRTVAYIEQWKNHEGENFWVFPEINPKKKQGRKYFDNFGNKVRREPTNWPNSNDSTITHGDTRFENTGNVLIWQAQTPVNLEWFDSKNPLDSGRYLSGINKTMLSLDRNKNFFNHNDDDLINFCKTPLIRNGRLTGHFELPKYKIKGRGYGNTPEQNKNNLWNKCTRDVLKYNTESYQDNEFDDIMGIQQKKSSWDSSCIIENTKLTRTLEYLKEQHGNIIWDWTEILEQKAKAAAAQLKKSEREEEQQEAEEEPVFQFPENQEDEDNEEDEDNQDNEDNEEEDDDNEDNDDSEEDEENESEQEDEENESEQEEDVIQSSDNKITQDVENKPQLYDRFIDNDENKSKVFDLIKREGYFIETDEKKIKIVDLLRREGLI